MAYYSMTSSETLINNEVQDNIDIVKKWTLFTPWDTIQNDRDRQQVLKNHVNERLTGSKRDFLVATIDAMWSGWKGWKNQGWKTVQEKFINGFIRMQGVLASSPDVVTQVVRETVAPTPVTNPTQLNPPVTPPPNQDGSPRVPVTVEDKIFGIPKKYVKIGGIIVGLGVGYVVIKKVLKRK